MYWCARHTKVSKARQTRLPARWHGTAVVIGHEWNADHACDSYWLSHQGTCLLVNGLHMRHADLEELMTQEQFVRELKRGVDNRTSDPALHVDLRAPRSAGGKRPSRPVSWPSAEGAASTPSQQVMEELTQDGQERVKRLRNAGTFSLADSDDLDSGILFGRTSRATGSPAMSDR